MSIATSQAINPHSMVVHPACMPTACQADLYSRDLLYSAGQFSECERGESNESSRTKKGRTVPYLSELISCNVFKSGGM